MSDKAKRESPLVKSVLALDNYLAELERIGTKINSADMTSDIDVEFIQKLMTRFAECGEGISQEVVNLSTRLQEAQACAEAVAKGVSSQAELFKVRRNEQNEKLEQFRILGERVRDLNAAISQFRRPHGDGMTAEDRAKLKSSIPAFEAQVTTLIEELQALRKSARESRMKALEKNVESLVQTLQVVRKKLGDLSPLRCILPFVLFLMFALPLTAQWFDIPTRGVPRTADGKPDLNAATPRTADGKPDFSGMWRAANRLPCDGINRVCGDLPISPQFGNIGSGVDGGLPYQQWVRDRIRQKRPSDDPYTRCIAPGGPRMHMLPTMKKWVQNPGLLIILDEYNASYRQIFLDGRALPEDPNPTWNGYATAHWDGDTLVVESTGYRDDQWLDAAGSAITSGARVTERIRRVNYGTLLIDLSVDDPKAYTRPWSVTLKEDVVVDTELIESICAENEKDVQHLNAVPQPPR